MAKPVANKEYFTFVRGLITEASALTYPENASRDEANFVLNRNGSRRRRQGMDYESNYALGPAILNEVFTDKYTTNHVWKNAANSGLNNFSVVQAGDTLYFYDLNQSALSFNRKSFTVDLNTYKKTSASNLGINPITATSGKGVLFVVSEDTEPFYIEYNPTTDTISTTQITLEIRDFLGVDDGLADDNNPSTLSATHEYNLLNQGWTSAHITTYNTSTSTYPSNAQVWWNGKNSSGVFNATDLDEIYFGNTPAPKGHFILNLFDRDRDTVSGVTGVTTETENGRPSTVAFYAGRAFYSGIKSDQDGGPSLNGYILFSQIIEDLDKVGRCYQSADPTSEVVSDLVATDGGVIVIPEVGVIRRLEPVRDSLVIFADNGVWQLKGDTDAGFTADAFNITKITNVGAVNDDSIVTAEGTVFYWSDGGIYALSADQATGLLQAQNITETTIQTAYQSISSAARINATGTYDPVSKRVSWLYNSNPSYVGGSEVNKYDSELVFDVVLTAFYKNTISSLASNSPYVAGYVVTPNLIRSDIAYNVVNNNVQVQNNAVDVVVNVETPTIGSTSVKYLTVVPQSDGLNSKLTYSLYTNSDFYDWKTADGTGVNFVSYLWTGHELMGDTQRPKQATYLTTHFSKTETGFVTSGSDLVLENPSGCTYQARWDFSDSSNSGRWTSKLPAYRFNRNYIPSGAGDTFDYGFDVITTKNKLRGHGRALSLYFESETGKDCEILGWAISYTGNSIV